MEKIVVTRKNGYTILADMHPVTKKLIAFYVKGVGANPNVVYNYISEAENLISQLTKNK